MTNTTYKTLEISNLADVNKQNYDRAYVAKEGATSPFPKTTNFGPRWQSRNALPVAARGG